MAETKSFAKEFFEDINEKEPEKKGEKKKGEEKKGEEKKGGNKKVNKRRITYTKDGARRSAQRQFGAWNSDNAAKEDSTEIEDGTKYYNNGVPGNNWLFYGEPINEKDKLTDEEYMEAGHFSEKQKNNYRQMKHDGTKAKIDEASKKFDAKKMAEEATVAKQDHTRVVNAASMYAPKTRYGKSFSKTVFEDIKD